MTTKDTEELTPGAPAEEGKELLYIDHTGRRLYGKSTKTASGKPTKKDE